MLYLNYISRFFFKLKQKTNRCSFKDFGIFTIQGVPEYREQAWKFGREHSFIILEDLWTVEEL